MLLVLNFAKVADHIEQQALVAARLFRVLSVEAL
jgi:hypothetical protein